MISNAISKIRRTLHDHGIIYSERVAAERGEYRNVFCPHCGAFIPHRYRHLTSWEEDEYKIRAPGRFRDLVDCPSCNRASVVIDLRDEEQSA